MMLEPCITLKNYSYISEILSLNILINILVKKSFCRQLRLSRTKLENSKNMQSKYFLSAILITISSIHPSMYPVTISSIQPSMYPVVLLKSTQIPQDLQKFEGLTNFVTTFQFALKFYSTLLFNSTAFPFNMNE